MGKETRDEKTKAFSKKKISLKMRLLAAVVSPIAFFLLFELVLTLLGYGLSNKFFVPWHMGDVAVHVPNKQFCEHFVPQSLSRTPEASVLFPKTKSQFRIFVLGGSAANGDPDPDYGFCRQLEILLNDHAEGTTFQVVNAAITAMNSHVARGIARDCAKHSPDLFILYTGNNEVVGPYGPPTLPESLYRHKAVIDLSVALKKDLRVGQLVKNVIQAASAQGQSGDTWEGMEAFLDSSITQDDPRLQSCYLHFKTNIQDIVAAAHGSGAKSLVCTVPTNIASCAPFGSAHRIGLSETDLAQWNSAYEAGRQLELAHDYAGALVEYKKALAIDDRYADLAYGMGQCLLKLKKQDEARDFLIRARDLDTLRFRADTSINQVVRDQAKALASKDASLLDLVGVLEQVNQGRPLGKALLLDHVHLNVSANFHAAKAAMASIKGLFPAAGLESPTLPDDALYAQNQTRLLFDVQEQYKQAMVMYLRKTRPPFEGQLDHDTELTGMRAELFQLRRQVKEAKESESTYTQLLTTAPEDLFLIRRYGDFLLKSKRTTQAIELYKEAYAGHPYDTSFRAVLAKAYASAGGHKTAMGVLMSDQGPTPCTEKRALLTLGSFYVKQRRYPDALQVYSRLDEIAPMQEDILVNLASALSSKGDLTKALQVLNQALQVNPESVPAMINMGNYHVKRGETQKALSWFERAAKIDPYNYIPQFSVGMQKLTLGEVSDGMKYVTQSVHLKPDFVEGYNTLAKVYKEFDKTEAAQRNATLQALFTP